MERIESEVKQELARFGPAGAIGAVLAAPIEPPFEAACAGVWLHGQAARRLGAAFIADDLAEALTAARAPL